MEHIISPLATYRIQFHQGFTFSDAKQIIPYLHELGVDTIYASPIFEAVPGSMHGYDVVNPLRINPELGSLDGLRELSALCKAHKLHWIQDVVPNHMAFHPANEWLMDVLEKGVLSAYAPVFDTGFSNGFFSLPLMAPFLGSTLEEAIVNGEISLVLQQDRLKVRYFDQHYPVNISGYKDIVENLHIDHTEIYHRLQQAILHIEQHVTAYNPTKDAWKDFFGIWHTFLNEGRIRTAIRQVLRRQNTNKRGIIQLCQKQWYRLCHWEESNTQINYRRFFTVNGLICLQAQDPAVFNLTHQLIKELVGEGIFQGLRIDHIDGLFNPEKYVNDLRGAVGEEIYIVVEKILEHHERLPSSWPIAGTSGYDYLTYANNLFINTKHERAFGKLYQQLVPQNQSIISQKREKKALILHEHMVGEAENLFGFLIQSHLLPKSLLKRIGEASFREAIAALLTYFPVYRFYGHHIPLPICEREQLALLFAQLQKEVPAVKSALRILEELILTAVPYHNEEIANASKYFYQRLMQFSGPIMAKGVEDTLMYTYNRFIGSNEVGNSPETFGMTTKDFHATMEYRQCSWPLTMNATATHDTKRGEDARARLQALSCLPTVWKALVKNVERALKAEKSLVLPETNDRYFIYQILLASFPTGIAHTDYPDRLANYIQKALREAKINSNWTKPNEVYEQSCVDFATLLLDKGGVYWPLWSPFLLQLVDGGMFNSLSHVLLKTTAPGVPDFYQGTEFWDLSFVDPDNRRDVDYEERHSALRMLKEESLTLLDCWKERSDGKVKLLLVHKLLRYRKEYSSLFQKGVYIPIKVRGRYGNQVLAFCRRYKQQWSVCLVPLQIAAICADQRCSVEDIDWKDTRIDWPTGMPGDFFNLLKGKNGKAASVLFLTEVFSGNLPLAVLHAHGVENARAAGVLMAISSLPSAYGIGDLGSQAHVFAQQLATAGQRYWQLLPLNPTGSSEFYSPYSAYAVFAGNPLFISPELLGDQGLLSKEELKRSTIGNQANIAYEKVVAKKQKLLDLASERFLSQKNSAPYKDFERFMEREREWLDDYVLYLAIKKEQQGKAWYTWPEGLKMRRKQSLAAATKRHVGYLLALKWQQYEFFKEWNALKTQVETLSIRLLGDLPIYANYDSVDVWCNKQLFALDKGGNLKGAAGVPPDYFNAEGQLWGMPTFNWKLHESQGYAWWIARLRKNLAWYHVVRLDHFRAFYDYWEVPAGEESASAGTWKDGPRERLFAVLQKELGKLPLVAEDLGDIHAGVIHLRDQLGLPGMKVLQFAFGEDMARSPHIPHEYMLNSVVYTGTHDNSTVAAWFKEELTKEDKKRLFSYLGHQVRRRHVHEEMIKMAYASVAFVVIVPLQDVLGLGKEARMNTPATTGTNWKWRLLPRQLENKHLKWLNDLALFYNR